MRHRATKVGRIISDLDRMFLAHPEQWPAASDRWRRLGHLVRRNDDVRATRDPDVEQLTEQRPPEKDGNDATAAA